MKISVAGLGMVSKCGDTGNLEQLLTQRQIDPGSLLSGHTLPIDISEHYPVSPQLIRRMSHFAKLALLSACQAIQDSGLDLSGKPVGIIQGSVYGPIVSAVQAFDDLIDFGDNQLSPTNFSGSVYNTSATYLSLAFGIQGPTLSHTSGLDTLYNSLLAASLWLENREADFIIMGIGDEYTTYFDTGFLPNLRPTDLLPTCEGWTTFILSRDEKGKYGKVNYGLASSLPDTRNEKNIYSVWHEQIKTVEFLDHARNNQACFPVYLRGSYPSASAFDLALALVCGKNRRFPVYNNSSGDYHIQDLAKNEGITCYSIAENNDVVYYEIEEATPPR